MSSNMTGPVGLAEAHRRLEELDRAVDATRLALSRLRDCLPPPGLPEQHPAEPGRAVIEIPDTPYDPAMWQDAEDEGIGRRRP
ncbi:hypothetical protein ABIA32_002183 [Streptacidiphilus sp. MAP12-20]|uniref:hypothetical protein n=1 Tax=Streptacidiphilus sp. MAP12-20 TaxID=3156299 RepID=UPI003518A2D7